MEHIVALDNLHWKRKMKKSKKIKAIFVATITATHVLSAHAAEAPAAWGSFDGNEGRRDAIIGHQELVPGVRGMALSLKVISGGDQMLIKPGEGLQGVDSFFPFQAADGKWYGFYGSAQTQTKMNPAYPKWSVGLAEALGLAGPWKRCKTGNPVIMDPKFAENPVVSRSTKPMEFPNVQ